MDVEKKSCKILKTNDQTRLTDLEEKCAWLENVVEEQGKALNEALKEICALKLSVKILLSKSGDPYATRDLKDEVPPPHY